MSSQFRLRLLPILLAATAAPLFGQTQNPKPSGPPPPVIRATTRLIQVDVVVQNEKGEPVEDLKQEDFSILDQGKPQQVALFPARSAASRERSQLPVLPPRLFSNRFGETGQQAPHSVTVILFDTVNTSISDIPYAREQVIKFLKQLRPGDHVAIYLLGRQLTVLNEFTQDVSSLLHAIERFSGAFSPQLDATNLELTDSATFRSNSYAEEAIASRLKEFLDRISGPLGYSESIGAAWPTCRALEAIANHVASIPGRKSLVWVSGAFPISIGYDKELLFKPVEHRDVVEVIERAARALNHANMAIYPVDARGLMTPALYDAANRTRLSRNPRDDAPLGVPGPDHRIETMIALADRTGGKAFYNTNDMEGSVRRAIEDGQSSYTLGFYPAHRKWDGKFHQLKVQVKEKGLSVRYRKGYFAKAEPADGSLESKRVLDDAVRSPVDWTNLDLHVALGAFEPSSHNLEVQIALDTHELGFEQKDGRWKAKIYVVFVQLGKGNKSLTSEQKTFVLNLKPETYNRWMQNHTEFSVTLALSPEIEALRVVAADASSNSIGTLTIPIKRVLLAETVPTNNPPAEEEPQLLD